MKARVQVNLKPGVLDTQGKAVADTLGRLGFSEVDNVRVGKVIELADNAEIKTLYLFHHDPDQSDIDIDGKFEMASKELAKRKSKTEVKCPQVGQTFML